jgi:hypothetical protein
VNVSLARRRSCDWALSRDVADDVYEPDPEQLEAMANTERENAYLNTRTTIAPTPIIVGGCAAELLTMHHKVEFEADRGRVPHARKVSRRSPRQLARAWRRFLALP